MRYLITESQLDFIRRYEILKNLIYNTFDLFSNQEDSCDYTFRDFLEEVKWQVSDQRDEHKLGDNIEYLHNLIEDNFYTQIRKFYDEYVQENCRNYDDDDNLDYYSLRFGIDNN